MKDNPRIFCSPPLLFGAVLIICLWLDGSFDRADRSADWARVTGAVLVTAGSTLIALGLGLFFARGTRPEPWAPASTLVTGGIYRVTRNPMYLGMATVYIGVTLYFLSILAGLIFLPLALLMDRIIIPREEAYLLRRFGKSYVTYRQRVRRWL